MKQTILIILFAIFLVSSCREGQKQEETYKYTNALIDETSPYLLQHAHNPVDWRPWSEEALELAEKEDKLVLVSIGYSSCHWCHVMEEETFEDEAIAEIMNSNFINIKVDREERPDVDQVYMTALQLIKGSGGWPLNVITLPNGKPLYGGTYHTNSQWKNVITEISQLYKEDPDRAREYADRVAAGVQEVNLIVQPEENQNLDRELVEQGLANWKPQWDEIHGGNKGQQKFMLPSNLDFLLQYEQLTKNEDVKKHSLNTMDRIALGGIYDHVGGGFFRYSTDPEWKIPHFEKMLYDNAQLIGLYSKAYKAFKNSGYKEIVYETFDFLQREMKNESGGYFAALDADSEGEEGKYYIWKEEELRDIVGSDFEVFSTYYNIKPSEKWEGDNFVLHKPMKDFEFAGENGLNINEFRQQDRDWKQSLLSARNRRIRPGLDDKIITSWNALLIEGLVEAYKSFGDQRFLKAAQATYSFIIDNSSDGDYLVHSFKENARKIDGFLDDYAYMTSAAIQLYEVTANTSYLDQARIWDQIINKEFRDDSSDLFRYKRKNDLISKIVKINDGVMPSPNASVIKNQLKLGHILYDTTALSSVERAVELIVPAFTEDASNYTDWGSLLLQTTYPYYEIAVVGNNALEKAEDLHAHYLPNTLIVASSVKSDLPLFEERFFEDDTYIFVCQNNSCKLPTTSVSDALGQLDPL